MAPAVSEAAAAPVVQTHRPPEIISFSDLQRESLYVESTLSKKRVHLSLLEGEIVQKTQRALALNALCATLLRQRDQSHADLLRAIHEAARVEMIDIPDRATLFRAQAPPAPQSGVPTLQFPLLIGRTLQFQQQPSLQQQQYQQHQNNP